MIFDSYRDVISIHTHTRLTALCPGLPGSAGTRKVKPVWILLKQERMSGSGISWAICNSAPCSRQIIMPAPHHSVWCDIFTVIVMCIYEQKKTWIILNKAKLAMSCFKMLLKQVVKYYTYACWHFLNLLVTIYKLVFFVIYYLCFNCSVCWLSGGWMRIWFGR